MLGILVISRSVFRLSRGFPPLVSLYRTCIPTYMIYKPYLYIHTLHTHKPLQPCETSPRSYSPNDSFRFHVLRGLEPREKTKGKHLLEDRFLSVIERGREKTFVVDFNSIISARTHNTKVQRPPPSQRPPPLKTEKLTPFPTPPPPPGSLSKHNSLAQPSPGYPCLSRSTHTSSTGSQPCRR